jgi:hypothetical protein
MSGLRPGWRAAAAALAIGFLTAAPPDRAAAQRAGAEQAGSLQQASAALLPDSVAERMVEFYNLEPTTRLTGDARIGAGTGVRGGIAMLAGNLIIEGNVEGDVVVINGQLDVRAGGRIGGSVTVAGGDARVATGAVVTGAVRVFREPLRYRHVGGRIVYIPAEQERGVSAGIDLPFGRTDMLVASHGPYNRVEGLPIAIGPRIRFAGSHPVSARAIVIARTARASELEPRRIGYDLRAEQLVEPRAGISLGARLYSEIASIEEWGLSEREAALAAFVLHRDYRDYYERRGWSLYTRLEQPGSPYTLQFEYRDEEHESRAAANPLTILDNRGPWRPQPAVAEGRLRALRASARYDTRNEPGDPSAGWQAHADLERGLGGGLSNIGLLDPESPGPAAEARTGFLAATIDVRRYARLTPYSRLAVRTLVAGSLDARALPAQRQHALGGEGSLPGYRLFEFDCGARRNTITLRNETLHPYYGCDRLALVQLEYQANFPFARRLADSAGVGAAVGSLVRWVAFFDAGRAWTEPAARAGRLGGDDDFSADAGVGLRVGPLGAYVATPLSGRGQGVNFFIRLGPRI